MSTDQEACRSTLSDRNEAGDLDAAEGSTYTHQQLLLKCILFFWTRGVSCASPGASMVIFAKSAYGGVLPFLGFRLQQDPISVRFIFFMDCCTFPTPRPPFASTGRFLSVPVQRPILRPAAPFHQAALSERAALVDWCAPCAPNPSFPLGGGLDDPTAHLREPAFGNSAPPHPGAVFKCIRTCGTKPLAL